MVRRVGREEGLRGVGLEETIRRVGREGGSAGRACVRRERFNETLSRCARGGIGCSRSYALSGPPRYRPVSTLRGIGGEEGAAALP